MTMATMTQQIAVDIIPEQFSSSPMSQLGIPSQLLVAGMQANIVTQRYSSELQSIRTRVTDSYLTTSTNDRIIQTSFNEDKSNFVKG